MSYYLSQEISRLLQGEDNRKPVGQVEIDWSHPLTRGLKIAAITNEGGLDGIYDLVSGSFLPLTTSVTKYADSDGIYYTAVSPSNTAPSSIDSTDTTTLLTVGVIRAVSADTLGADIGPTFWMDVNAGYYRPNIYSGAHYFSNDQFVDGDHFSVAVTAHKPIGVWYASMAVNGELRTSSAHVGVNIGSSTAQLFGGAYSKNGITGHSGVYFRCLWDRKLSDAEIVEASRNPYAFIKPAANAPIYLASAGVGGADHNLLATSVESASAVSTPTINQIHALTATSVESASVVSTPLLSQVHVLTSVSVESASVVSVPTIGQVHNLTAISVESASVVSTPTLTENTADHVLTATSVESASTISTPALAQTHALTATSVESGSTLSSPNLSQVHILGATSVEAASIVSTPSLVEFVYGEVVASRTIISLYENRIVTAVGEDRTFNSKRYNRTFQSVV